MDDLKKITKNILKPRTSFYLFIFLKHIYVHSLQCESSVKNPQRKLQPKLVSCEVQYTCLSL